MTEALRKKIGPKDYSKLVDFAGKLDTNNLVGGTLFDRKPRLLSPKGMQLFANVNKAQFSTIFFERKHSDLEELTETILTFCPPSSLEAT